LDGRLKVSVACSFDILSAKNNENDLLSDERDSVVGNLGTEVRCKSEFMVDQRRLGQFEFALI
jgi:hypothetical protein